MDTHTLITVVVTATVFAAVFYGFAPVVRKLLHKRFKTATLDAGVPSAICSKCHKTTHRFVHLQQGGIHCSKCALWE